MFLPALLALVSAFAPPTGPERAQPLPLVVMAPAGPSTGTLALLLTGDGGWSRVDRTIAQKLTSEGDGVIGLNSLHYFQHKRTSSELAADLTEIARANCERWSCQRIVLIGYSMGADVLPFVVNQLGDDVRAKVVQLDLISLGHLAVFKFSPTQWVGVMMGQKFATLPALANIHGINLVCIYGTTDSDPACKDVAHDSATVIAMPSGHVMSKVADDLAEVVAEHINKVRK
jgi:type IV secretory pathway VirJ component